MLVALRTQFGEHSSKGLWNSSSEGLLDRSRVAYRPISASVLSRPEARSGEVIVVIKKIK